MQFNILFEFDIFVHSRLFDMSSTLYYKTLRINVRENRNNPEKLATKMIWSKRKLILKTFIAFSELSLLLTTSTSSFCNCIGDIIVSVIAPCAVDYWIETRSGKTNTIELSDEGKLINNQFGFRPGRSTVDAIFILHGIISNILQNKLKLYSSFVEFRKAFDKLNRKNILQAIT